MNRLAFEAAARLVQDAFRDSGIFLRGGTREFLEQGEFYEGGRPYLVLAAGLGPQDSDVYFSQEQKRREALRVYPLRLRGDNASAQVLLCFRPVGAEEPLGPSEIRTPFAPGTNHLGYAAIKAAYLRFFGLPDNQLHLRSLRLEYDPQRTGADPKERWLLNWATIVKDNPAHPAVHLHINSVGATPRDSTQSRPVDGDDNLRFGVGFPNPLVAVLSLACWYRRVCLAG